jgi:hypothetical protein
MHVSFRIQKLREAPRPRSTGTPYFVSIRSSVRSEVSHIISGSARISIDFSERRQQVTMTMSSEEIKSKFFDYVDQRQALYIERLGEAVG